MTKKRKRCEISDEEVKLKKVEDAIDEYLKDDRDVAFKLRIIEREDIKLDLRRVDQLTKMQKNVIPIKELRFVRDYKSQQRN